MPKRSNFSSSPFIQSKGYVLVLRLATDFTSKSRFFFSLSLCPSSHRQRNHQTTCQRIHMLSQRQLTANTTLEGCCQVQEFSFWGDRCNVNLFDLCVRRRERGREKNERKDTFRHSKPFISRRCVDLSYRLIWPSNAHTQKTQKGRFYLVCGLMRNCCTMNVCQWMNTNTKY